MRALLAFVLLASCALGQTRNVQRLPQDARVRSAIQAGLEAAHRVQPNRTGVTLLSVSKKPRPSGTLPYTGLEVTSVGAGFEALGLPCYACVPDVDPYHVATPVPQSAMPQFAPVTFTVQYSSDTYDGACVIAYALVRIAPQQVLKTASVQTTCLSQTSNVASWNDVLPDASGDAVVVGVAAGTVGQDRWFHYLRILE